MTLAPLFRRFAFRSRTARSLQCGSSHRARSRVFRRLATESLEPRTLLFSPWTIIGDLSGNITFEEDPASTSDDTVVVALNPAGRLAFEFTGSEYEPFNVDFDISVIRSVAVNATGGSDRLVLDFANGSPVPVDGIDFRGGEDSGDADGVELMGYDAAALDLVHQGIDSANLRLDESPDITYAQIESLTLEGTVADLLIDLSQTGQPNSDVVVRSFDFLSLTPSAITGSTFGSTWFANPTNSLTIDLQASGVSHADSIRVENFLLSGDTDLTIRGGSNDTFESWAPTNVGPTIRDLTVTAGTIDIHRALVLSGSANLNAAADITFYATGNLTAQGTRVLIAAGGDVQLDANVRSDGGHVSVVAGGDVNQNAAITTHDAGTISVTGGDDITMSATANTVSANGQILYSASGDLELAVVRTTGSGSVRIISHEGTMSVKSTLRVDVGGNLTLEASGGPIVFESSGRLQTAAGQLDLWSGLAITMAKGSLVDAGGGDISLAAQFGVLLGRVVSPGAMVTIDAGLGGIADGADPADPPDADGADIEADIAVLRAYGSIGSRVENTPSGTVVVSLDTKVNQLDAVSENGVGIFIVNDGPLVFLHADAQRVDLPPGIVDITATDPQSADEVFSLVGRTNPETANRFDVNGDGIVSALDALILTEDLNQNAGGQSDLLEAESMRMDVNRDGLVSPLDLLYVINHLNRHVVSDPIPLGFGNRGPFRHGNLDRQWPTWPILRVTFNILEKGKQYETGTIGDLCFGVSPVHRNGDGRR